MSLKSKTAHKSWIARLFDSRVFQALILVFTFVGGYVANDFVSFRSEERRAFREEYAEVQKVTKDVDSILATLSKVATGKSNIDPKIVDDLSASIRRLYAESEEVARRAPELKPVFEQYASALVELQKAAQTMTGPLDGKRFVDAVESYYFTKGQFEQRVVSTQQAFRLM